MSSQTRRRENKKVKHNTRHCPPGKILRKAFTRRYTTSVREKGYTVHRGNKTYRAYPSSDSTVIRSSCIKDRGLTGKGKDIFGTLKKGQLLKHGYSYRKSSHERHEALRKAIHEFSRNNLYHKLDAVAKLSSRTAPEASKIFREDSKWLLHTYK